MRRKVKKHKIVKGLAVFTLSTSCILGSLGLESKVSKASSYSNAESMLANLTQEQREALQQLSTNEVSGLQISPDTNLNSLEQLLLLLNL